MAIFTSVILLAQNASSTVNENLQVTEGQLQNANQELDLLKEQYNTMLTTSPETSFFNFGNMYFWFVLVGLLLLAFGLLFLLAELQNKDRSKKSQVESIKKDESAKGGPATGGDEKENSSEEDIAEEEPELAKESEEEKTEEELVEEDDESAQGGPASGGDEEDETEEDKKPAKKMDKPIKIKVEKIK
jgi:flagellar biosynthesis/type III secretory pathway M-ring protein FliF/YscJ